MSLCRHLELLTSFLVFYLNEAFIVSLSGSCCRCLPRAEVVRRCLIICVTKRSCAAEGTTSGSSLTTFFHLRLLFRVPGGANPIHTPLDGRRRTREACCEVAAAQQEVMHATGQPWSWRPLPPTLARPSALTSAPTLTR